MSLSSISSRHGFSVTSRVALEDIVPAPILRPDGTPGSEWLDVDPIVDYMMKRVPAKAKRVEIKQDVTNRCYYDLGDVLKDGMKTGIVKCAGASPAIGDSSFFNGHDKYYTNFVKLARDPALDFFDLRFNNDDHYRFFAPKGGNVGRRLWQSDEYREAFRSFLDDAVVRFTRRCS